MYRKDHFFLIGISTVALLFTVMCSLTAPQVIVVTATPGPAEAEATVTIPEALPANTQEVEPIQPTAEGESLPMPTSQPANPQTSQGGCNVNEAAWVGSLIAANCVDAGWRFSWSGYRESDQAITVCADNRAWIVSVWIDSRTGDRENHGGRWVIFGTRTVACDSKGGVWVAHYKGAHYFDGSTWTEYKSTLMGNGDFVDQVKGVTVAPDGSVWFVTSNSVAKFDGSAWTIFETGNGFSKDYYFTAVAADPQGNI
jgi:hypothetical protein